MDKLVEYKKTKTSFKSQNEYILNKNKRYNPVSETYSPLPIYKRLDQIKSKIMNLESGLTYNLNSIIRINKMDAKIKYKKKRDGD